MVLYIAEFWQKFFIAVLNCGFVFVPDSREPGSAWMEWYTVLLVETIYIFPMTNFFVQTAFLFLFYMLGTLQGSKKVTHDSLKLKKKSTKKSTEIVSEAYPIMILKFLKDEDN